MDHLQPIFTEKNNCQDCYKCIRECPVKAIKIENNSAWVESERCIYCGHCVEVCPPQAKRVRDDVHRAKMLVKFHRDVYVSIAPSFRSEFPGVDPAKLIGALKKMGVKGVSETAVGAEIYSRKAIEYMKSSDKKVHISSACPSAVELIRIYHPHLCDYILPIKSPLLLHAEMLREQCGSRIKVIFVGPCIAKKLESDRDNDNLDVAIGFNDLKKWFQSENIAPAEVEPDEEGFLLGKPASGSLYPIDGGMVAAIRKDKKDMAAGFAYMSFSGTDNISNVLDGIEECENSLFLELLACHGGCINGPLSTRKDSTAIKRLRVVTDDRASDWDGPDCSEDKSSAYYNPTPPRHTEFSELAIKKTLLTVGKLSESDMLNCGACGYDSCRKFAIAMLEGRAERSMCASYMRKVASDKASALLQKMPSGVVIVDDKLKIVESNASFARILGEDIERLYAIDPGLAGADLTKTVPFHKLFASVLQTGQDTLERDVRYEKGLLHVSIFTVQQHKLVGGIIRDMARPEVRKDEVIQRARKVIKDNLATVQKIAYLLGENASQTEEILNSIIESHKNGESGE